MFRISIARKLSLSFAFVLVILTLMVLASVTALNKMNAADQLNAHTYKTIEEANRLMSGVVSIETGQRGFLLTGDEAYLAPLKQGKATVETTLKTLRELTADNPAQQERLQEIDTIRQEWLTHSINASIEQRRELLPTFTTISTLTEILTDSQGKQQIERLQAFIGQLIGAEQVELARRADEADTLRTATFVILVVGGGIAVAIGIATSLTLSRNISSRLRHAVEVAEAVARGDLTVQVQQRGGDEIATLLGAFSDMQHKLADMIAGIRSGAGQLAHTSQELSVASQQIAQSSSEQTRAAAATAASVEQLTSGISHVNDNAAEAHRLSLQSGELSAGSSQTIAQAVRGIEEIAATVTRAANEIAQLETRTRDISSIIDVIKDVADQTNLLALNAAIEAARAGEQGRGFAVVADEVRKLAERTATSTSEISGMIAAIQTDTRSAVATMRAGVEQVGHGVELANQAGDATREIHAGAEQVVTMVNTISSTLHEQSQASATVAGNVEHIASMAEQNGKAIMGAAAAVEHLHQLADTLNHAASQFRLS